MEPVTTALIGAGASLLSSGTNAYAQGRMNKKTREYNTQMYERQKADNLDFWNMQNTYNSPEQQVKRLQDAGVSPMQAFGGQPTAASGLQAPHAMPYNPTAPKLDLNSVADQYFNIQTRQQQLQNDAKVGSNLDMQNALLKANATSQMLDNQLKAETYGSNLRGILGKNEMNYSGSIQKAIMSDILTTLSGNQSVTPSSHGMKFQNIDGTPNKLLDNELEKFRSIKLGNILKKSANTGNNLSNELKSQDVELLRRLKTGNLSDLKSADWLKMILPMLMR